MNPCTPRTSAHRPDLPDRISPPSHTPTPITSHDTLEQHPYLPLKAAFLVAALIAIPRRELQDHKCLRSSAHINNYEFPQAMRPTPQHPHRRGPASSRSTTENQPNRSTYPEAKLMHNNDRAHCPDARTTVRQPPYAGTHHGRQGPGRHHRGPRNTARASRSYTL